MTSMATQFAPSERAGLEELETQRRYFTDSWFFGELLHYVPDMVMILNHHRQVVYANRPVLAAARVTARYPRVFPGGPATRAGA